MNQLRKLFIFLVIIWGNFFYFGSSFAIENDNEPYLCPVDGKVSFIELENKNNSYVIVLSDKSQWIVKEFFRYEKNLQEFFSKWNIKDSIEIIKESESTIGEYYLKNKTTRDEVLVELDKSNREEVLACSINKIDSNGYFITTDNGMDWTIGWIQSWTAIKWRKSDKIMIYKSDDGSRYLLINLNTTEGIYVRKTSWK